MCVYLKHHQNHDYLVNIGSVISFDHYNACRISLFVQSNGNMAHVQKPPPPRQCIGKPYRGSIVYTNCEIPIKVLSPVKAYYTAWGILEYSVTILST